MNKLLNRGNKNARNIRVNKRISLTGLYFPEFKSEPFVCSVCIYEKLTGEIPILKEVYRSAVK